VSDSISNLMNEMPYGSAPESTSEAGEWLASLSEGQSLFIDGEFVFPASSTETFASYNPARGEKLTSLAQAGTDDVDAAVKAARAAQPGWAALSGYERAKYLYALARLIQKNARLFAVLETLDNGKTIRESRDIDIPLVLRHFYYHAGWAQLQEKELPGLEPLGVVGQVIPWNFPLLMLAWKIAPAIAMGNTAVLKPAEFTSLTAILFAQICAEAGLPKGVVNIITGDGRTGAAIVEHPDVDKIAFTGSTEVGRIIRNATAGTGKKLTLELGGKSPFIVFEDADLDGAVEGLIDGIWFNQGEVCCAGSRLLVQEGVEDALVAKLKARLENFRVGDPMDKTMDMGAVVDASQAERIDRYVKLGAEQGAEIWQPSNSVPEQGCFYPPTMLLGVEQSNVVAQEEIFGPVLSVMSFRTKAEAIELANNTRYGLAASIWSETIGRALDVAPQLKAGVVWVNGANMFDAACGFGGYRESGFGREGGIEGLYEYLKLKLPKITDAPKVSQPQTTTVEIDRTAKMYIAGKQSRPDGGYTRVIYDHSGQPRERVGEGNRKDVRNAVESATKAHSWSGTTGHLRSQIIYYIAENLSARRAEFEARLKSLTGATTEAAAAEVDASLRRLFAFAAWADKYEGRVHAPPLRGVTLAMNEPLGVVGVVCPDEAPLLSFVTAMAPHLAVGNRSVIVAPEVCPLLATDFYQILETSDVPGGVVNILTGGRAELAATLAAHDGVDGLWYLAADDGVAPLERASAGNLKRMFSLGGQAIDWADTGLLEGRWLLREAVQVKNVWIPYGD